MAKRYKSLPTTEGATRLDEPNGKIRAAIRYRWPSPITSTGAVEAATFGAPPRIYPLGPIPLIASEGATI